MYKLFIIIAILLVIILLFIYITRKEKFQSDYVPKYPKVIYFCNKTLDKMEQFANNWKKLNPDYMIKLYDNKMCRDFLVENYGEYYGEIFDFLKHGPIKADFWRACILYKNGGVYSDIDNMPLVPLKDFIEKDIEFVTCSAYMNGMKFNPNFIIATKEHIILKKCIDWYIDKYERKVKYTYGGYSIMTAFTDVLKLKNYNKKLKNSDEYAPGVFDKVITFTVRVLQNIFMPNNEYNYGVYYLEDDPNMKVQIIEERPGINHYDAYNVYNNIRVFNNRYPEWNSLTHSFK
jgi:mannosyltransferase OCH1-like enzyme